ncbi:MULTISPECIES: bifunctional folylpolyglutamate synthase/dihydrofolate synthase [Croceitalea]|uniref:Dihydrofolate synthase/folylpolyglutamate synthase n=1 Tax=Croceitalea vernalis TaxID=3075599 RepID=A0ABU3BJX4_9FLAO|nr:MULTISPECIES: folylpolyglutamate synthase/dihydrofolate synthase family protein [unclassified Croceitalea]MDT0540620.1 folylpolyglutamate synthase/dihydrofolate synthase family protein [Croceitalea sp. P059]MDT0622476.1 folylpolyglutamate synthase/dihydrofolate synthase family protein [Croceitalea sp. P007]
MTYKETVNWMFAQLPMYQQKGVSALKNKLDNIENFSFQLNKPEKKFKSIHVAGTNGKGSSCHMLASILQEAGYKVGLYTSPHLKDFRERIKINGQKISKKFVVDFIQNNDTYLKYHQLSFFEMTVGMAFDFFAKEKVDIAIIEVGLGGRLDSTNIITPEVSLITNIGLDHVDILGDTIEKIALEKAGIIKRKVPVVISETQSELELIFKLIATQLKSRITFADKEEKVVYQTDLLGKYQQRNISGVLATLKNLRGFEIEEVDIQNGLRKVVPNTGLLGRWQKIQEEPMVVCDTAHNKEGLQLVLKQISNEKFNTLHIVLGVVKDKDLGQILPLFPVDACYYFVKPNVPRGLCEKKLKHVAESFKLKGKSFGSVKKGYKSAKEAAENGDFIYIGGSTFVVAEVV